MSDALKKLYIEPSSRCNLSCTMCFRKAWQDEVAGDMPLALFHEVLATMPADVETIFFGGMGEPLVNLHIIEMVRAAATAGKRVELLTNGTLLFPPVIDALLQSGLSKLWISIDSFDDEDYERIRGTNTLALIKTHIAAYNKARRRMVPQPELAINFVAMKSNVRQMSKIPVFASYFEVNEVNISNVIPTDKMTQDEVLYKNVLNWSVGEAKERFPVPRIQVPLMDWREDDVLEGLKGIFSNSLCDVFLSGEPVRRKTRYCRFVAEGNAFVRHDGHVSPCMALLRSATTYWKDEQRLIEHHSFGTVGEQGLQAIWDSAEYVAFRARVLAFEFSPCFQCSHCDRWLCNESDCFGNEKPTCGGCLWSEGVISCP